MPRYQHAPLVKFLKKLGGSSPEPTYDFTRISQLGWWQAIVTAHGHSVAGLPCKSKKNAAASAARVCLNLLRDMHDRQTCVLWDTETMKFEAIGRLVKSKKKMDVWCVCTSKTSGPNWIKYTSIQDSRFRCEQIFSEYEEMNFTNKILYMSDLFDRLFLTYTSIIVISNDPLAKVLGVLFPTIICKNTAKEALAFLRG